MNNLNKKIIILLLLITSFLGINTVNAIDKKIEVTDFSVKDKSGTILVEDPVITDNVVTSNITFNEVGDFVTFKLVLKNNESKKYKIESITDNNSNKNITIDYSFSKNYIKKGETSTVEMKLTYKNKLINKEKVSLNDLTIKINLVNEDGKSSEIIINPTTGDAILHYMILLILALTGLILNVNKKKLKGFKVGSLMIVLSVVLIPFVALANERYEVQIKFNNIDVIGEYETYNITIDPKNGDPAVTKQITYGEKIGALPADPTKDGYTFDKWVDNKGNKVTEDTTITGPISIEAKYNIVKYDITYNLDGGSVSGNPTKYTIEDTITLKNPSKQGYTFTGWTGTGIDTQTTSVTIPVGSTGARNYVAHYSASEDTAYTVIHKFAKLTEGYDIEEVTEHGTTGSTVPAPRKTRTGFVTPSVQNVTIAADGSASVTYIYERETYAFSITDRTYLDSTSTADGTYPYGTEITLKAQNRPGYTFTWSDGNDNYERTFELEGTTSLTPVYTANTNTKYVVKHYKQKVTLDGYEIADTQNLEGTTDSPITPAVNTYTGFVSPATQTTTINGDGSTVVTYNYDRETYAFSVTDRTYLDTTSTADGTYPYGKEITVKAATKPGYTFIKWSNNETSNPYTFTLEGAVSINPVFEANTNTPYTVLHKKQNLDDLTKYTTADTDNLTGTTDTDATPAVRSYAGFTAPATQTKNIDGNGNTTFEYLYTRNLYTLTITHPEYVVEDKSGSYYYEDTVSLTAIDRPGYTFAGWSTGENTKTITVNIGDSNITVEPLYTSNTDTTYKVIHKYAKLTSGYDTEEVPGTGTTGDTIPAPRQPRTGFVTPAEQNITITADGQASVTYIYERVEYTFEVTNRSYLDNTSTPNGSYLYETTINLKALAREGYTFAWSDEVTALERSFNIDKNTSLSLVYIPNVYTIEFDPNTGEGDMEDQDMSYDETDNLIPNTFTKEGYSFVGWNTRADGQGTPYLDEAEVTNLATSGTITLYAQWIINEYTVSFNTDGGSTVPSQTIAHGGKVTRPAIDPTKTGCTFDDWYTTDSFETVFDFENTTITSDTTIYAKFEEDSFSEVFSEPGECTFNGSSGVLTGDNCSYANGTNKYIDTGINLYNNENHDKDYEIGFTIVSYNPSEQVKQATFMNTKLEGNNYPGLVFRRRDNYDNLDFSSRKTSSTNERKFLDYTDGMKVKIYRITNEETGIQEIFYSINDEEKIKINDLSQFNPEFDLSVWFGAAPTNASATAAQRILVNTTLKDMYIKLGTYQEEKSTTYTVQLDANGGSVSPTSITKDKGLAVGELPTPTPPEGKTFDGWYTGITEGVKVDETYMPNINTKIFARYIDDCPSPVSFSSDSWDTIVCNVKKNNISKYTVGSTRTVSLSGLGTHTLRVANTSTPDECNGTGFSKTACGFVVEFSDVINVHNMDNEGNAGGWKDSDMRTYVNDTIYNALPTDLKNSIIDTKVVSEHSSASDAVNNTTIDKLYLLSKNEIVTNTAKEFTRELDYYEKTVISPCSYNNCVVLKKYTNYYALYWLRTPYDSSNTSYAYVDSNGFVPRYDVATNSNVGVSPAFRIGNPDSDNVEFNNITFDLKNGNTLQSVIEKGSSLSSLTNLTNQSLPFEGWYIDENYETKLTNSTVPSGNTTYFAKWKYTCEDNDDSVTLSSTSCSNNENITIGDGIVCKRAVKLHEETCQQNSSFAYCSKAGYSYGDTITYGSCGTSGMLNSGDAFTCDVNGDGSFDELTERFYYISDYYNTSTKTFDSDTAVLLYYNSVKNGISCNSRLSPDVPYDNSNENWHGPVSAYGMLPSTTVWSNVSLKNSTRQLLNEEGNATVKSHDLGLFNYNDKAARLLTIQELKIACGDNINDTSYLNSCDYVLENTSYSSEDNFRNYLTWLENPKSTTNNMVLSYVSSDGNRAYTFSAYDDLSVRPAIEVPKESIAIGELPSFTVTFETDGGSAVSTQTITYGNTATRPATDPSKTGYTFDDWYTNDNYSTKFDFSTPITNNTTIYAKFDNPCKTFSTDSWETIRDNLENDSNYYAVGCEKQVELDMKGDSNPKLYTVRLVNTSTPDVCNIEGFSQTGCGFVIDFVYNVSGREMNIPTTNEGGWKETSMVTYLNSEFYNKLPLDLKNVIIPTYPIVSGSGQNGISEDILASDIDKNKIYLLSSREVGFDHSYDNKNNILTDTRTLDYYVGSDQSELDSKRKKYTIRTDSSIGTADWWLRNAIDINTGSFDGVSNYGTAYGDSSYRVHGVTPAFRIGTNQ